LGRQTIEECDARLLVEQYNILEGEQPSLDLLDTLDAALLQIGDEFVQDVLVELVKEACYSRLSGRNVPAVRLRAQPQAQLVLDQLLGGRLYRRHGKHALEHFAARRLVEGQQCVRRRLRFEV